MILFKPKLLSHRFQLLQSVIYQINMYIMYTHIDTCGTDQISYVSNSTMLPDVDVDKSLSLYPRLTCGELLLMFYMLHSNSKIT